MSPVRRRRSEATGEAPTEPDEPLISLGRFAGSATLILSGLAAGPKHGYALTKDIEAFAGVRIAPGTLYEALSRLERMGLIEALETEERRKPYQLTPSGAAALKAQLDSQRQLANVGLRRLNRNWNPG